VDTTVLDWNLHAVDALINAPTAATPGVGQPPGVAALHLAMVQGAVYDAVNMIDRGYQPYLKGLPHAPRSASMQAAVATAAHDVLVGVVIQPPLTPTIVARLDGLRDATIAAAVARDGQESVDAGIAAGTTAATAMLAARTDDGRYVPLALTPGTEPGQWRPELPAFGTDLFAWISEVDPFTLKHPSQFRTKGPLALSSRAYAKEYNEVKELGGAGENARTPKQEALAQFYANTNPVEMFPRTFRAIAVAERLTLVEQARLFAMLNLTLADTMIACVNEKVHWNFWRPITAIREGDNDGNPRTAGDPAWLPFAPTPPYADHTSGYNCVAGAFMYSATAFFGKDRMDFSVVKAGTNEVRHYKRFTDVVDDIIDVRVYHGLHFRTADVQGAGLGKDIARWVADHHFEQR
jgi:hypothetical protein